MREKIPIEKNKTYKMTIDDLGTNGEGIGKVDGFTLFVPNAVPGDLTLVKVIKIKKNYGFGRVERILKPSTNRANPLCSIADRCGGCQLQHIDYATQLAYKQEKVQAALERIGDIDNVTVKPTIGMETPYEYRNKVQYPVGTLSNEVVVGFYANRSHNIIPVTECYIQDSINEKIIQSVIQYMNQYGVRPYDEDKHKGLVRHIVTRRSNSSGEVNVTIVINGKDLPSKEELIEELTKIPDISGICININKNKTNTILGKEIHTIWGRSYIFDKIGDIEYKISPLSFYQVNPLQTEVLYNKALEYAGLTGNEIVWDAYCGIGTITLFLAQKAKKVYGVEIVPQAIEDARENAKINQITNVEFFVGKAEKVITQQYDQHNIQADVIVVDPPRKGCDPQLLDTMIKMNPERIVYVSCDPATMARDIKVLVGGGYEVQEVQPVDMFPQTTHVETVVALYKKD